MDDPQSSIRDELKRLLVATLELDVVAEKTGTEDPAFEPGLDAGSIEALAPPSAVVAIPDDPLDLAMFQDICALAEVLDRLATRAGGSA